MWELYGLPEMDSHATMHNIGQRTFRGTPLNFLSRSSAIFSILGAILIRFGDFK
jgi:hypothetical protein